MKLLKKISLFLVLLMIFNLIFYGFKSYAVELPDIDMSVEVEKEFAYSLGFGGKVASVDVEINYDPEYLEFVGVKPENVAVNEYENGKVAMAFYDITGKNGIENIKIILKGKKVTGKAVTKLELKDINIYSLVDNVEYTIDDLNTRDRYKNIQIYKPVPEETSSASTSLVEITPPPENPVNTTNNQPEPQPNTNNNQNNNAQDEYIQFLQEIVQEMIRDREESRNQQPVPAPAPVVQEQNQVNNTVNTVTNTTNGKTVANEIILLAKSNKFTNTTNSITATGTATSTVSELVSAANAEETNQLTEAIEDMPKTGKQVSIVFIILSILAALHFTKFTVKYKNFKKLAPVICLILFISLEAVVSNASTNIVIRQYTYFGDLDRVILVIPNDEIRNISYEKFIKIKPNIVDVKEVYGPNHQEKLKDELVASKDISVNEDGREYRFIVYGDFNSDGKVNALDIGKYIKYRVEEQELTRIERKIINVDNIDDSDDLVIDTGDLDRIRDFIIRNLDGNILRYLPEEVIEDFAISAVKTVINKGEELQLDLITFPENSTVGRFEWVSSDPSVATVDDQGLVKGLKPGNVEIRAYLNGNRIRYSKIGISVESRVTGVFIDEESIDVKVGFEEGLNIYVTPEDATNRNVFLSSSDDSIATISNGKVKGMSPGRCIVIARSEDGELTDTVIVNVYKDPTLVREIELSRRSLRMMEGTTQTVTATPKPSTADNQTILWQSMDPGVASATSDGVITALKSGYTVIKVASADGNAINSIFVTVYPQTQTTGYEDTTVSVSSISLSQANIDINIGEEKQLYYTISPSNATFKSVVWESLDPRIATVDDYGVVKGVSNGETYVIVRTLDGFKKATCKVTVKTGYNPDDPPISTDIPVESISLDRTNMTIVVGSSSTLNASFEPSNATNKTVLWTSSNPRIATVTNSGKVTAVSRGSTIVTVESTNGKKATCLVTVTESAVHPSSIRLDKTSLEMLIGEKVKLTPTILPSDTTNVDVTWESTDSSVATVDASGNVEAKGAGNAIISVKTVDMGRIATCSVKVTDPTVHVTSIELNKTSLSLYKDDTETLVATVKPNNATNPSVNWSSNKTSVATVDNTGKIKGVGTGVATITATTVDGALTATCEVTVSNRPIPATGITISEPTMSLIVGERGTLTASVQPTNADDRTYTFSSSNSSIATVTNTGVVTAVSVGSTDINAISNDGGFKATCRVTVTSETVHVAAIGVNPPSYTFTSVGQKVLVVATVYPENASNKGIDWASDDTSVATVSRNGEITAKANGTTKIRAISKENPDIEGTVRVTVNIPHVETITVSPDEYTLTSVGETKQLSVTVLPENAGNKNVTWTSDYPSIATVNSSGKVTAVAPGTTRIRATSVENNSIEGSCLIKVEIPHISSISVEPSSVSFNRVGDSVRATVTVLPENAIDKRVTWESGDTSVATVNASGDITSKGEGETYITIRSVDEPSIEARVRVVVTLRNPYPVTSVDIRESDQTIDIGETMTLHHRVLPDEANQAVVWSSSNPNVVQIESGSIKGMRVGTSVITATSVESSTISDSITVTVIDGTIVHVTDVDIEQSDFTIPRYGQTAQLSVKVYPEDAVNKSVTWSSSNSSKVSVTDSGLVTCRSDSGSAIITATSVDNPSASDSIEIVCGDYNEPVESVEIDIREAVITVLGGTVQLRATVLPVHAVDRSVDWSTSNSAIATVSSSGVVTAIKKGTVTITAKSRADSSISDSVTVRVEPYVPVTDVTINDDDFTLTSIGATKSLRATVSPSDATNQNVRWESGDTSVVTVSTTGVVTAKGAGTARITAYSAENNSIYDSILVNVEIPVTSVKINETDFALTEIGATRQLHATVLPSNATNQSVRWSSGDTSIVTVSNSGLVTAKAEGIARITVTSAYDSSINNSILVEVRDESVIHVTRIELDENDTFYMTRIGQMWPLIANVYPTNATNRRVNWSSSNSSVVSVDSDGVVTAVADGTATITAKSDENPSIKDSVTIIVETIGSTVPVTGIRVSSYVPEMYVSDGSVQFQASVLPTNATNQNLIWSSSDTSVATVNSNGLVTPKKAGTVTITVKSEEKPTIKQDLPITVKAAVTAIRLTTNIYDGMVGDRIDLQDFLVDPTLWTNGLLGISISDSNVIQFVSTSLSDIRVDLLKAGSSIVTFTLKSNPSVTAKLTIRVTNAINNGNVTFGAFTGTIMPESFTGGYKYNYLYCNDPEALDRAIFYKNEKEIMPTDIINSFSSKPDMLNFVPEEDGVIALAQTQAVSGINIINHSLMVTGGKQNDFTKASRFGVPIELYNKGNSDIKIYILSCINYGSQMEQNPFDYPRISIEELYKFYKPDQTYSYIITDSSGNITVTKNNTKTGFTLITIPAKSSLWINSDMVYSFDFYGSKCGARDTYLMFSPGPDHQNDSIMNNLVETIWAYKESDLTFTDSTGVRRGKSSLRPNVKANYGIYNRLRCDGNTSVGCRTVAVPKNSKDLGSTNTIYTYVSNYAHASKLHQSGVMNNLPRTDVEATIVENGFVEFNNAMNVSNVWGGRIDSFTGKKYLLTNTPRGYDVDILYNQWVTGNTSDPVDSSHEFNWVNWGVPTYTSYKLTNNTSQKKDYIIYIDNNDSMVNTDNTKFATRVEGGYSACFVYRFEDGSYGYSHSKSAVNNAPYPPTGSSVSQYNVGSDHASTVVKIGTINPGETVTVECTVTLINQAAGDLYHRIYVKDASTNPVNSLMTQFK